jgi:inner membrane protein YidH
MGSAKKQARSKHLDPDARFLLANERTLLAWIRTSLAVMAGGVALTQLGDNSRARSIIGITAIVLGGFMASVGYLRFKAADKAIRQGELPPAGSEPFLQVGGIILIALALVLTHLFGVW